MKMKNTLFKFSLAVTIFAMGCSQHANAASQTTESGNGVFIFLRGFFKSVANLEPGVKGVESVKIYPLNGERKPMKFQHASDVPSNALFAHDFS